ncbi:unnamed protein product [Staurois parvus]|uniref:Uncharacterized protein n=1 Tax=Staurois parvus TaxID=386267 RepID=A0ABN9FE96_9NEOB|nr:unnamed protein product [Staurois parvus]
MHSPKEKKNTLAIYTKLSMYRMVTVPSVLSGDKTWTFGQEKKQRGSGSNSIFTQCRGLTP